MSGRSTRGDRSGKVDEKTERLIRKPVSKFDDGSDHGFDTKRALINDINREKNSNSGPQNVRTHTADQSYISVKDYYLTLDNWSKNVPDSNLPNGFLAFNLFSYFSNMSGTRDKIAMDEELVDAYEITLSPFIFPEITEPATLFAFKRVFIEIANISRNCIYLRTAGKYHFECSVGVASNGTLELTPIKHRNKIIMKHPLYQTDVLNIIFHVPMRTIPLPNDTLTINTLVAGTNPGQIISNNHGLNTGDLIYCDGLQTGISSIDIAINSKDGLIVTFIDPNTFSVPVDCSSLLTNTPIQYIYIAKNRIMLPLHIRGLTSDTTQFIVPV